MTLRALTLLLTLAALIAAESGLSDETGGHRNEEDPSAEALRLMFNKYGERGSRRMTFEGFEHLLESLGLGQVVISDHDLHDHRGEDGRFHDLHEDHLHNDGLSHHRHHHHHHQHHADHDHPTPALPDHQRRHERSAADDEQSDAANGTADISQVCIVVNCTCISSLTIAPIILT